MKLKILEEHQKLIDRAPFHQLQIDNANCLNTIEGREICEKCYKSRKFFCYSCYLPVIDKKYIPQIKLPIKIDIIKHIQEIDGKSTAIHAAIIAPEDVKIYTYPNFPEFSETEKAVLIFPSVTALNVKDLFILKKEQNIETNTKIIKNELPITRAVFIDSTWHQTKSIYKDHRLQSLSSLCYFKVSNITVLETSKKKSKVVFSNDRSNSSIPC
ncbi:PREDICTED: DTW domain-containing protein 1 isoform X2 [Ceratosolen solmsi marchali]|uniref:tRNA-uridine aminocarboxypropyltransferase 1 n=1 Tax=Ceratosolen solmsi marchali TaxID=326594 RepID=A0AAJ6YK46_9HYME|nr:PREDICTED: DTW domain-containing protein 1 isoform X2 [Ceratosolen solmsi marchali]